MAADLLKIHRYMVSFLWFLENTQEHKLTRSKGVILDSISRNLAHGHLGLLCIAYDKAEYQAGSILQGEFLISWWPGSKVNEEGCQRPRTAFKHMSLVTSFLKALFPMVLSPSNSPVGWGHSFNTWLFGGFSHLSHSPGMHNSSMIKSSCLT